MAPGNTQQHTPPQDFKTDEGMKIPWRVRFPSASATCPVRTIHEAES